MHLAMVFFGACSLFLIILPFLCEESKEARRMLTVVKSNRSDARIIPLREIILSRLGRIVLAFERRSGLSRNSSEKETFAAAGVKNPRAHEAFVFVRIGALLLAICIVASSLNHRFLLSLIVALLGSVGPKLWLSNTRKRRRERVRRGIPDVIDLLVICIEAGLGLEQAILRIGQELAISHAEMAEELERLALERQAGSPRIDTWRAFSQRLCLEDLTEFANLLAETERFGTPIARALHDFSQQLRTRRRQKAEEAAAKLKVKIMFPLVLCIFPCLIVVLLGPAMLSLKDAFAVAAH